MAKFKFVCIFLLVVASFTFSQEQSDPKTLLPDSVLYTLINELSGTQAYNHILELAPYEKDRPKEEYDSLYRESVYIEKMAKLYGFSDVHIEHFPQQNKQWDGELGELWMEHPEKKLIVSYRDITACLAQGSQNTDTTGELIYCGRGDKENDYEGKQVAGKIVLVSGPISTAHNLAVRKYNALGVLSYANPTGKPIDRPDQIAWSGLGRGAEGQKTTFGFNLSHRMGMELLELLEKGEKVVLHAKVKVNYYDADMEVPTAVIPGNGISDQEVVLVGHLFEGIAKQGANDDASGCAAILEIGRALIKLINEGKLARPARTIRFLWVPEISGSLAYLTRYPEERSKMIAAISMDMVGEDVRKNRNSLHLYRNPYSMASFLDDVCENFFYYVGETNREKLHNRSIRYAYMHPIVDPNGSLDPFYYNIEKFYGASDHIVFNNYRMAIPAVLFNNWPDIAYHTSEDRAYNSDPTQLKRACFIAAASAYYMASMLPEGTTRLMGIMSGNGSTRIQSDVMQALDIVTRSGKDDIVKNYKEAKNLIHQAYLREAMNLRSIRVFIKNDNRAQENLEQVVGDLLDTEGDDQERLQHFYEIVCKQIGVKPVGPKLTDDEIAASKMFPVRKPPAKDEKNPFAALFGGQSRKLSGLTASEALAFTDGAHSILDIRNAVSAEVQPIDVKTLVEYFEDLGKAGVVEIKKK